MASNSPICLHNKFGHCKFANACRLKHISEKCAIKDCEVTFCVQRHPKTCTYFSRYGRCKFGNYCSFSHEVFVNARFEELQDLV